MKRGRSNAGGPSPTSQNDQDIKRKRLEAWKAMQNSVGSKGAGPEEPPAKPVQEPAKPVQGFKMGMKQKPTVFKMGAKKPTAVTGLGFAQEEEEDPKPKLPALVELNRQVSGAMFSPPASPEPGTPPGLSDMEDDVDPLDAFMSGISSEVKESIGDALPMAGPSTMRKREEEEEKSKLQTISMEDIMSGKIGNGDAHPMEEEDEDKMEADRQNFMDAIRKDREEQLKRDAEEKERIAATEEKERQAAQAKAASTGRFLEDEEEDEYWVDIEEEEQKYLDLLHKKKLAKELPPVDHSKIEYMDFQRDFYIETDDVKRMSEDEVSEYRKSLDEIKIWGKDCPRPIKKWTQCGLPSALLTSLKKHDYDAPFAIQCQALPAIMSGRDVIGVAKTGSGKTLAFVIPMLRHIKAQPPLADGDGPIGIIMAPTRELATQIFTETRRFCKPLNLTPVCAYGGAPMSQQVGDIKAGAEIVVCTPGRAIDLLTLNGGRVMNLQRTTYVVMDEADRMFDMGFEPQVQKIIKNIRPDRQTVMFSATFPKVVEKHAKSILHNPIQIVCGGVSVVSNTIEQHIEVVPTDGKLKRLLLLLAQWYDLGENILIFVDKQDDADELFRDLIKAGYVALTLHGGKDQNDRDHTLADFKNKDNTLMIATSVAARGLDVKELSLVINFACPNHYEDYVHRVGRTGRAGRKGTAYTFIEPEDDMYAGDMIRALEMAGVEEIPEALVKLNEVYKAREKKEYALGNVIKKASGFTSGKGFKFDEAEGKAARDKGLEARAAAGAEVKFDNPYGDDPDQQPDGVVAPNDPNAVHSAAAVGAAAAAAILGGAVPAVKPAAAPAPAVVASATAPAVAAPVDTAAQMAKALEAAKNIAAQNPKVKAMMNAVSQPAKEQSKEEKANKAPTSIAETIAAAQKAAALISAQAQPAAGPVDTASQLAKAQALAMQINQKAQIQNSLQNQVMQSMGINNTGALSAAQQIALQMSMQAGWTGQKVDAGGEPIVAASAAVELEINDYPQQARWKVTHKDSMNSITENYAVSITTRGSFFQPGRNPPPGERKLYLSIEGHDENSVVRAKRELRRMLEEAAAGVRDVGTTGRYNV
eukprot:TRINITY_DN6110_c0_g3_i3.p1 TRINITY_DN6110_c0_g3~~TRINITY_DN6110_c0_g3_i3.p1  ORF type:complete len:1097 (+),score=316.21 TRINITY_DN6110_c0_g3_i3:90-3380(+)